MDTTFIFPDSLHDLTLKRLNINLKAVEDFLSSIDRNVFQGRISDINLKCKTDMWTMNFYLDGRKSGKCFIEKEMQTWIDAGMVSVQDVAIHFCGTIKPGFTRVSKQRSLFD